jgi:hypothetical protein
MKVYLCYGHRRWREERRLLGVYLNKQDAVDMCVASGINSDHSIEEHIEEHEVIE